MGLITVEDEEVPLAVIEQDDDLSTMIFDEAVPLAGLPGTGDASASAGGLLGTLVMSFFGGVGIIKKRKNTAYAETDNTTS